MSRYLKLGSVALATALFALGCAQERPPRSFVQPNAIKKADLEGTWYYIQTVTDAPATSNFMFIGNSSELMKVRFDIEENYLYARRAYEQIQGSEDAYTQDPGAYQGQPLAAWKISSQFDIIRDYNSTTGEETNKIIESQERPWNEREYIRVDWSQNLVTDYVGLGLNFLFTMGASVEPVSYWESDPTKPDALHIERADKTDAPDFAQGEANYIDITNKMVVTPAEQNLWFEQNGVWSGFTVPSCFLAYQVNDCASQIVKVRHAFAKISPTHDYQPRMWDGLQMNQFGIWDVGLARLTYNRQYGVTNSGVARHAARFNLWQQSHTTQACNTTADCNPGSDPNVKCDTGVLNPPQGSQGLCTIPYAQRQMRTIPYYAESSMDESSDPSANLQPFPTDLFSIGQNVISQWNDAVKNAVADVTGSKPTQDVFVWCHNPVQVGVDPQACIGNLKPQLDSNGNIVKGADGNPIYKARQGDPRRSNIFWVNQEQNAGPLGYGPPLFDPETGETISGQAYIYGAALDTYAARSRDLVLLVLGQIDPNNYVAGTNVQAWVNASRAGVLNQSKTYSAQDVKDRFNAMNFSWARGLAPEAPIDASSVGNLVESLKNREDAIYKSGVFSQNNADIAQVRRDRLKGGVLEAMMVTPDVMDAAGVSPGSDWTSLSEAEKWRTSPLRSGVVRQAIEDKMNVMRELGVDFDDFADEGITQRALALAAQAPGGQIAPEVIRQQIRKDIFLAVTLHEVGHNMGLRHNFRGSFDAMNYFPQYWQLRQGAATAATSGAVPKYVGLNPTSGQPLDTGKYQGTDCTQAGKAGHIRPRYIDCPGGATSVAEVQGGVREYQYSSIMDYGAEFNSDLHGLGHYDKAAMKFSYAGDGYVEVFQNAKTDASTIQNWLALHTFQDAFGFPSPLGAGAGLSSINYTSYPDLFQNGFADIEQRADVPYSKITDQGDPAQNTHLWLDPQGRPQVPYFFCSDEFVGNLTCQRFDSGADAYEQAEDLISRYNNFYLLNNFKRDQWRFHSSLAYWDRIESRYLDMLREQLTWYALLRSDFTDYEAQISTNPVGDTNNFFTDENGWGEFTLAVTDGFDQLGKIISMPEAGLFAKVDATVSTDFPYTYYKKYADLVPNPPPGSTQIDLINGKYIDTTWDFSGCGYYWADECETRIGYFRDKTMALDELTQSQAYFTGRDTSTDVRKYAIGYILPFKSQIQEKFGALFAGDYQSLAPYFNFDTGNGAVVNNGWTLNTDGSEKVPNPSSKNVLIDPAGGFTLQLYAGVYGLSSFPTTFDQSFIDTTQVFVIGNGEAPIPDSTILGIGTSTVGNTKGETSSGSDWFIWTDTESGKQYAAHSIAPVNNAGQTGYGTGYYRNDTGARMLEQAATMQQALSAINCTDPNNAATCYARGRAIENFRQNIQIMRSLHNAFGYGVYKTDAPFYY